MTDTTTDAFHYQNEVFNKMAKSKRIRCGFDFIDFGYNMVKKRLEKRFSSTDLTIEIIRTLYSNDFNQTHLQEICNDIKSFQHQ
jgi:pantothenate kinase